MCPAQTFGGLSLNICGDFLQLPPVDTDGSRRSLAMPLNDTGKCMPDESVEAENSKGAADLKARLTNKDA